MCPRFNVVLGAGVGEGCGGESGFGHGLDSRGDFDLEVFFGTDFSNGIDGFSVRDAMAANGVIGFIERVELLDLLGAEGVETVDEEGGFGLVFFKERNLLRPLLDGIIVECKKDTGLDNCRFVSK